MSNTKKNKQKEWICPSCGRSNPPAANFCGSCGTARASEIIRKSDSHKNPLPLILAFVLLIAAGILLVSAFVGEKPTSSGMEVNVKPSTKEIADVIPFPVDYGEGLALIALYTDGTVRTNGLEKNFDSTTMQRIESWSNIKQIVSYQYGIVGLKTDGSVVFEGQSLNNPCDPAVWKNVRELYSNYLEFYGLTKDGRVLVPAGSEQSDFEGAVEDYLAWRDIVDLCPYSYPESRGVIGIKSDGSICAPGTFGVVYFPEKLKDVKQLSSSGYLTACLRKGGTIKTVGMYASMLPQDNLQNVEQVVAREYGVVCRMKDGNVKYLLCENGTDKEAGTAADIAGWKSVTDIQTAGPFIFGLTRNGDVLTAEATKYYKDYFNESQLGAIRRDASRWNNIERIKAWQCYGQVYLLGWQKNGNVVAAGIDLTWVS